MKKKDIIIVDLSVKKTSPAGSCVLSEVEGLIKTNEFNNLIVFTSEIEESIKKDISFLEVKMPKLPNLFRYILFHYKVKMLVDRKLKTLGDDYIIQTTQGQYSNCDISYPHFCHKAYLKLHWHKLSIKGLRAVLRKKNHQFNAFMEEKAFSNAKLIVVPSRGLANEISSFYPSVKNKIVSIPNPVDVLSFKRNTTLRNEIRQKLNLLPQDLLIVFSALGDFERKGLGLLLESLSQLKSYNVFKILVVGGKSSEISTFRLKCEQLGILDRVFFVGFQSDIRPYFWAGDLFSLPSTYEVFPLVAIQAAAASLPLLVTKINGVDEYVVDNYNGWYVERNVSDITSKLLLIHSKVSDLGTIGHNAACSVNEYDFNVFQQRWIDLYNKLL